VILLDLRMPDMNGVEFSRAVRGTRFADIPIIITRMQAAFFWRLRSRAAHRLPGTATVGLWEAGRRRHAGAGRGPREGALALSGARLVDRAEAGESGRDLHLPTSGRCLIEARLADSGPLHGIHRRQAMKAKLLLIPLALAIATGCMTACKKKSAAAAATGKESTAVDTTMKK